MQGKLLLWVAVAVIAPLPFPGLGCACAHDAGVETNAPAEGGEGGCSHCPVSPNGTEPPKAPPIEKCCCIHAHLVYGVSPEGWAPIVVELADISCGPTSPAAVVASQRQPLRIAARNSPPLYLLTSALLL